MSVQLPFGDPPVRVRSGSDTMRAGNNATTEEAAMDAGQGGPTEGAQAETEAHPDASGMQDGPAEAIKGEQGEPVIEQDAANIGRVPDGEGGEAFRQSAPPATAQSGIPLAEDREEGVQPGETSKLAAPPHEQAPTAQPGVTPGSQP